MCKIINSVLCRRRSNPTNYVGSRYVNLAASVVDGKVKLSPSPVVAPALASETSISMNVMTSRSRVSHRGRNVVDAVDLYDSIDKIK